eukprot:scaffold345891_cov22-Prasinocladus_malaysianus.AAC.1
MYPVRCYLILVELVGHGDEVRAELLGVCHPHAGPDAPGPGGVVGARDLPAVGPDGGVADGHRHHPEGRVLEPGHRGEEGVHVNVDDRPLAAAQRVTGPPRLLPVAVRLVIGGMRHGLRARVEVLLHKRLVAGLPGADEVQPRRPMLAWQKIVAR